MKKIREFFFKNEKMRDFLKGTERRDEKAIFTAVKGIEKSAGERMIRKGTCDRSLYFVASGALMQFAELETKTFDTGSILGLK
jgi:hypothetical protein